MKGTKFLTRYPEESLELEEVDGVLADIYRTMRPGMNGRARTSEVGIQTDKEPPVGRRRRASTSMDMGHKREHFLFSMPFKNSLELRHHIESQVLAIAQSDGDQALRKAHNRAYGLSRVTPVHPKPNEDVQAQSPPPAAVPSYVVNGVDIEVAQLERSKDLQSWRRALMASVVGSSYLEDESDEAKADDALFQELRSLGVTTP